MKAGWGKWREVAEVFCDKKMSKSLKAKTCRIVIRSVMNTGMEERKLKRTRKY